MTNAFGGDPILDQYLFLLFVYSEVYYHYYHHYYDLLLDYYLDINQDYMDNLSLILAMA